MDALMLFGLILGIAGVYVVNRMKTRATKMMIAIPVCVLMAVIMVAYYGAQ